MTSCDLIANFLSIVQHFPKRKALLFSHQGKQHQLTYLQLQQCVNRAINLLYSHGLSPGKYLASLLPNSAEQAVFFLASLFGGFHFAPLDPTSRGDSLVHLLRHLRPQLILLPFSLSCPSIITSLDQLDISSLSLSLDASFSFLRPFSTEAPHSPGKLLITTSGTTGTPKMILLDGNRLWKSGKAFLSFYGFRDGQSLRFWNYLPMSYLGGLYNLLLLPFTVGATVVIDDTFSAATFLRFWSTVKKYDITLLWFVPSIVRGLLRLYANKQFNKADAEKIQKAFLGTAPISFMEKQQFEKQFGLCLYENYGLSETTFISAEGDEDWAIRSNQSVGCILPNVSVKICPQTHEIAVKSDFLFLGFLSSAGRIKLPLSQEGYFPTGDRGKLTEKGVLLIEGRLKECIKKGGYYLLLAQIEQSVAATPFAAQAAAVPMEHAFYGESYVLFVILTENGSVDKIRQWFQAHCPSHQWPEEIIAKEAFPTTATGKIQKYLLV